MIKKLFLLLFVSAVIVSCNDAPSTEGENVTTETEVAVLTVDDLLANISNMTGETVVVAGMVDHVCKHGGTKLVIYSADPENAIHVKATDESGNFRADEVGGEFIEVAGVVDEFRVDEAFILEKEAKLADMIAENGDAKTEDVEEEEHHHGGGDFPDNDSKHKQEIEGLQNQIASLKEQLEELKAEGKEYISYYSVKCSSYTVLEHEGNETDKVESNDSDTTTKVAEADADNETSEHNH